MLRRRRQLRPDYWPPASATTLKRLHHHPTPRAAAATRWSVAGKHASSALSFSNDDADGASEEEQGPAANSLAVHEDDSLRPRRWSVADGNSSELMMMMMMGVMGCGSARREVSSLGSCAGEPATPSPICSSNSPMSSLSSELCCGSQVSTAADLSLATANQSFCIMSDDGVEEAAAMEGILQHPLFKNHIPVVKIRGKRAKGLGKHRRGRGGGGRRMSSMTSCSLEGERRLPTVGEEDEEDWRRMRSNLHHCSTPLLSSSSDDHYCSNSSSFGCEYESSDSAAPTKARRPHTATETRMKAMQELVAWKEARTMKLMKKLEEEEASIDAWVKKKTTKAKMEMKQLERRLEKKRETGMEKMQRKIMVAKNKAEKKKTKEREAATQSISAVSTAFEKKKLTGKAPWRLLFF